MSKLYLIIDGENIDATLGVNILKRFPRADERPRWDRVLRYDPFGNSGETDAPEIDQFYYTNLPVKENPAPTEAEHPTPNKLANPSDTLEANSTTSNTPTPTSVSNIPSPARFAHLQQQKAQETVATESSGTNTQSSPNPATASIFANNLPTSSSSPTPNPVISPDDVIKFPGDDYPAPLPMKVSGSSLSNKNGLFFLNASHRIATTFVQALLAIGWHPILLTSEDPELKIVDMGIQKTLEAIAKDRPDTQVVLASHDVDYLPQLEALLEAGHKVAVMCFREYLAMPIAELEDKGLQIIDLEYDVNAFNLPLSRVSPIHIDEFDPYQFI